ncbi:hypothetical protein V5E97_36625 [Singulisphaera sp. Ch08]|uniref:Uncharacterized protein n=1 Tax=Singulisphaera sp. Ch08 TaxID=3120278 RepID=A0AAU7CEA3_9BACT
MTFRRLILIAIAFQAATPDLLDFSLLTQKLPPGAFFEATRLAPHRNGLSVRGDLLEPEVFPLELAVGDEFPENFGSPSWPESGLKLDSNQVAPARLKPGVNLPPALFAVCRAQVGGRHALGSAKSVVRPWRLHRLIC